MRTGKEKVQDIFNDKGGDKFFEGMLLTENEVMKGSLLWKLLLSIIFSAG